MRPKSNMQGDAVKTESVRVKRSCLWSKTIHITTTTRDTREDSEFWHQLRCITHICSQHNYIPFLHHVSTNTGSGNGVKWQYAGRRPGSTWRSDTEYPYPHQRAYLLWGGTRVERGRSPDNGIHACWLPSGEEQYWSSLAKPETHLSLQTLWNSVCFPQKTTSNISVTGCQNLLIFHCPLDG